MEEAKRLANSLRLCTKNDCENCVLYGRTEFWFKSDSCKTELLLVAADAIESLAKAIKRGATS